MADVTQIHIVGDNTTVVVVEDSAHGVATSSSSHVALVQDVTARRLAEAEHRHAIAGRERAEQEAAWARNNPNRYAEGGTDAFLRARARGSRILFWWVAGPVLVTIVWSLWSVGLPEGFLASLFMIGIGAVVIAAVVVIPAMILAILPAVIHNAVLDHRDERAARTRAEPRKRAERLARETAENDRRLRELGLDL